MIDFNFKTDFVLSDQSLIKKWIKNVIVSAGFGLGEISYVFCSDDFLHKLNVEFLNHDTLTDIISFDYRYGNQISGEIFISVERVAENAEIYKTGFILELHRVIIHGILHFCGLEDKTPEGESQMRKKEDEALTILHKMLKP